MTDFSSKYPFILSICPGVCKQVLKGSPTILTCGMPRTPNGHIATVYLQWCTRDGNFYSIEIIFISSLDMTCHMKACESPRLMVKLFENRKKISSSLNVQL